MSSHEIVFSPARLLVRQLRAGERSVRDVMEAFLDRIEECNPRVNALCTLIPREQALKLADAADGILRQGDDTGPLHGLPVAVKDLSDTRGIRTTLGSPIFSDNVPTRDSLVALRLGQAAAIIIGKTNTPEFGAGSHTFNPLFGVTRNPYNLEKTAGGSSGGGAAAVACGMLPLADGSDMGGSLRNPAAFCNIVGFRPSIGRVPHWPAQMAWQSRIGTDGPLARDVDDCALVLPATQVQPFDCNIEWVSEIEGRRLPDYIDWMSICCIISVFGLPAISVPAGFTAAGLPVGIQIVGPPRADAAVLSAARMFEQATDFRNRRPVL